MLDTLGDDWVERIVCLEHGPFVERLVTAGREAEVIPSTGSKVSMLRAARALRKALTGSGASVVHANGVKAAVVAVLATAGTRRPVVWYKHDFSWDGRLARAVGRRCALVIGVSAAVLEVFEGVRRVRTAVVYPGIEPRPGDRASAHATLEQELGSAGKIVVLSGRVHSAKGHEELVAIAPRLLERVPDARIVFLGGDDPTQTEYAARVRRAVETGGLAGSVTWLGHRDDAVEVIRGADALVVSSVVDDRGMGREGFSLVALEALAAGTPVVGYRHGGFPEVVGDCALLTEPGDRDALLGALVRVLSDDDEQARLGDCGEKRVRERFTTEAMAAGLRRALSDASRS
jgi:glycosyltransferase involved in cell wall biosynthesis